MIIQQLEASEKWIKISITFSHLFINVYLLYIFVVTLSQRVNTCSEIDVAQYKLNTINSNELTY